MQHVILKVFMALWTASFIVALLFLTVYFLLCRTVEREHANGKKWGLYFNGGGIQAVETWRIWVYGAKDKCVSHGFGCVRIPVELFLGIG